ncbi:MAG: hypothetical protein FJY66_04345 [Calditrichaeota bacterium]|nr:hypothetical protein [Calditrichota bacterium]
MHRHWLIIGTAFLLAGCDLFTTREAETPDMGQSSWDIPRVPRDVLRNMTLALAERNAVDYLRSIRSDTFVFVPDAVTLSNHPELADWGLDEETRHITQLLSGGVLPRDSVLAVVFEELERTELSDSAFLRESYTLLAGVTVPGVAHQMVGIAEFYLKIGQDGYWVIEQWVDNRIEGQPTWSELKTVVR